MDDYDEKMRQKYSMAICAYNNRLDTSDFDMIKTITVPEYNYRLINNYFAIELFLKLIIDFENKKIDFIKGHSIRLLWGYLSVDSQSLIQSRLGCDIEKSSLPEDIYTSTRYFWSNINELPYYMPSSLLEELKFFYEEYCSNTLTTIISKNISVRKKINGKFIEI